MYNIDMNVSDFRMNLKDCFDRAANGEVIKIERGGLVFYLATQYGSIGGQMRVVETAIDLGRAVEKHIQIDSTLVGDNAFHKLYIDELSSDIRPDIQKISPVATPQDEFAEGVEAGKVELPKCCSLKTPCRHWVIDPQRDGRVNTLSGEFKPYEI